MKRCTFFRLLDTVLWIEWRIRCPELPVGSVLYLKIFTYHHLERKYEKRGKREHMRLANWYAQVTQRPSVFFCFFYLNRFYSWSGHIHVVGTWYIMSCFSIRLSMRYKDMRRVIVCDCHLKREGRWPWYLEESGFFQGTLSLFFFRYDIYYIWLFKFLLSRRVTVTYPKAM